MTDIEDFDAISQESNTCYKCNTKPKINFAYSLTTGVSHKITDNAYLELSYS